MLLSLLRKPATARTQFPTARIPAQTSIEEAGHNGFPRDLYRWFGQREIALFDRTQVHNWLTDIRSEAGVDYWYWRPLSPDDAPEYSWNVRSSRSIFWRVLDGGYTSVGHPNGDPLCPPYEKPVPPEQMRIVVALRAHYGKEVKFLVSDCAHPHAGDFIAVCPAQQSPNPVESLFIFGVWNVGEQ